jgi:hypothetical protein
VTSDVTAAAIPGQAPEPFETVITGVAGYFYKATAPAMPGEPVEFRREPDNRHDTHAIRVHDMAGRLLGYLPRGIAAQYAGLLDHGCARLYGRLLTPGEPDYDPDRAEVNPPLVVWAYADEAGLERFLRQSA